jgi:hypothetical protein
VTVPPTPERCVQARVARRGTLIAQGRAMLDAIFIVVTVAFFGVAIAYTHFCARV